MIPSSSVEVFRQDSNRRESLGLSLGSDPWNVYASFSLKQQREEQGRRIHDSFAEGVIPRYGSVFGRYPPQAPLCLVPAHSTGRSKLTNVGQYGDVSPQDDKDQQSGSISTWQSREKLLLGMNPESGPRAPGLSRSSSADSLSNSHALPPDYEGIPVDSGVHILDDGADEDIEDVIEPVRAKAIFSVESTEKAVPRRTVSEELSVSLPC